MLLCGPGECLSLTETSIRQLQTVRQTRGQLWLSSRTQRGPQYRHTDLSAYSLSSRKAVLRYLLSLMVADALVSCLMLRLDEHRTTDVPILALHL